MLDAVLRSGSFDVRMTRLEVGDYLIDNEVRIERKSVADFAASLGPVLTSDMSSDIESEKT